MRKHLTHEEQQMVEAKVCLVHKVRMERSRGQLWKCPVCQRIEKQRFEEMRRRTDEKYG